MARFGSLLRCLAGSCLLFLMPVTASTHLNEGADLDADVDLHELCESLLRECWDLDPDDFGMTPVNAFVPSADGVLADADWEAGVKLGLTLLGEKFKVHLHSEGRVNASNEQDAQPSNQVPCADAPHCPDLIVDVTSFAKSARIETRTFSESHCAVVENATVAGERRLLRFTFTSPNMGLGDLAVGNPAEHPEWFEVAECHAHYHFREYADYRLWDVVGYAAWQTIRASHPAVPPQALLDAFPELAAHLLTGHKQGFCIIDLQPWASPLAGGVTARQFRSCHENQGITAFWADEYHLFLDGQWVDITGLAAGAYVLEAEVNPERLFVEANYGNNAAALVVAVP